MPSLQPKDWDDREYIEDPAPKPEVCDAIISFQNGAFYNLTHVV
jgi:hypothetical protein